MDQYAKQFSRKNREEEDNEVEAYLSTGGLIRVCPDSRIADTVRKEKTGSKKKKNRRESLFNI